MQQNFVMALSSIFKGGRDYKSKRGSTPVYLIKCTPQKLSHKYHFYMVKTDVQLSCT